MNQTDGTGGLWAFNLSGSYPSLLNLESQPLNLALVALFLLFVAFWAWSRRRQEDE